MSPLVLRAARYRGRTTPRIYDDDSRTTGWLVQHAELYQNGLRLDVPTGPPGSAPRGGSPVGPVRGAAHTASLDFRVPAPQSFPTTTTFTVTVTSPQPCQIDGPAYAVVTVTTT